MREGINMNGHFSAPLKAIIVRSGLSYEEISERTGVAKNTIYRAARGHNVRVSAVHLLLRALSATDAEILAIFKSKGQWCDMTDEEALLSQIPFGPASVVGIPESQCAPYRALVDAGLVVEVRKGAFQRPAELPPVARMEARLDFMCKDLRTMNRLRNEYWVGSPTMRYPSAKSQNEAIDAAIKFEATMALRGA